MLYAGFPGNTDQYFLCERVLPECGKSNIYAANPGQQQRHTKRVFLFMGFKDIFSGLFLQLYIRDQHIVIGILPDNPFELPDCKLILRKNVIDPKCGR